MQNSSERPLLLPTPTKKRQHTLTLNFYWLWNENGQLLCYVFTQKKSFFNKIVWHISSEEKSNMTRTTCSTNIIPISQLVFWTHFKIRKMAISSILSQIHQQVWRWSLETIIIHTKLKSQFLLRENPWKTWQKMCFNKMLQLIQIIMDQSMIRRNI